VRYLQENFRAPVLNKESGPLPAAEGAPEGEKPFRTSSAYRISGRTLPQICLIEFTASPPVRWPEVRPALVRQIKDAAQKKERRMDQTISGFRQYLKSIPYTVPQKLERLKAGGWKPTTAVDLVLGACELQTGLPALAIDGQKIVESMVFDTASADETFRDAGGRALRCVRGEPVVRDRKGIVASVLQGTAGRAAMPQEEANGAAHTVFISILSYPDNEQEVAVEARDKTLECISALGFGDARSWWIDET
jgi:hypothetical protein